MTPTIRTLRRRATVVAAAVAVGLSGLAEPATAGPATPEAEPAAVRAAMTWTVVGQQSGYVQVGSDGQTNPYHGDTTIDQYRSLLCLSVDDRPAPDGVAFDSYQGWSRGGVKATAAVRGDVLTSQARGDEICAENFGGSWRMAQFHDGRYGPNFEHQSGWSFWAGAGQLVPGARYWVAIVDQPANAWNSDGELPPPADTPADDAVVKTKLQDMLSPLLGFAAGPQFRSLVESGVAAQFDGDTNVLLSAVLRDAVASGIVDPNSDAYRTMADAVAFLQSYNGGYEPQVYIPNYDDGAAPAGDVTVVLSDTDPNRDAVPAYYFDGSGLALRPFLVDEAYSEHTQVWVLSINEGPDSGATAATEKAAADAVEAKLESADDAARTMAVCTVSGLRSNRGEEYLSRIRLPNLGQVASWLDGKVELRMVVIGKGGFEVKNHRFPKIKRKHLRNQQWHELETFITTWDRAELGEYWGYKWYEVSNGPHLSSITLNLSAAWKEKLEISAGVSVSISLETRYKDLGGALVGFRESTTIIYSTGLVDWQVCSRGGVEDNLAMLAGASASSTYPFGGYAPPRVNDGSRDTALGGASSWVNADQYAPGGFLPQWVQLDFGAPVTFNTLVVYTTQGYAIRDYQIQILNGAGVWQPISVRFGNTDLMVTHQLAGDQTARLVRILGTSGPTHQPQYVRVNEFEVYRR